MVRSLPLAAAPVSEISPLLCETNSRPSRSVPFWPKAMESTDALKLSLTSARALLVKRTTCLRSGQVVAQRRPSLSNARLPHR